MATEDGFSIQLLAESFGQANRTHIRRAISHVAHDLRVRAHRRVCVKVRVAKRPEQKAVRFKDGNELAHHDEGSDVPLEPRYTLLV